MSGQGNPADAAERPRVAKGALVPRGCSCCLQGSFLIMHFLKRNRPSDLSFQTRPCNIKPPQSFELETNIFFRLFESTANKEVNLFKNRKNFKIWHRFWSDERALSQMTLWLWQVCTVQLPTINFSVQNWFFQKTVSVHVDLGRVTSLVFIHWAIFFFF